MSPGYLRFRTWRTIWWFSLLPTRLRWLDWVSAKRAQVRELGEGRIGYLLRMQD